MVTQTTILRPPAEVTYADELTRLRETDKGPRPAGWSLSPKAVRRFLLGDAALKVQRKFYGDDVLVSSRADRRFTDSGTATVDRGAGALVQ